MRRLVATTALAAVIGLFAAGCGANDNGGTIQTPPSSTTTTSTATTTSGGSSSTLPGGD